MKIAAVISDCHYSKRFLVDVTDDELDQICFGKSNKSDWRVGCEIKVAEQWKRIRDINDAQENLSRCGSNIRAIAALLDTINVIVPPTEEIEGGSK